MTSNDINGGEIMPKNTSVTLGNHYEKFISQQVVEGRFGSASKRHL